MKRYPLKLAALLGAATVLGFSPFQMAWLLPFILAIFYGLLVHTSPRQAFYLGLFFGLGLYGAGISWVAVSIATFGPPIPIALLITLILIGFMALFHGIAAWCLQRFNRGPQWLRFACIMTGLELLMSFIMSGFPWLLVGTASIHHLPLIGFAPIISVYGVSFTLYLTGALLYEIYHTRKALYAVMLTALWLFGWGLSQITWTSPHGKPVDVALVQANIPGSVKWDMDEQTQNIRTVIKLTQTHWSADWILWSENALPMLHSQATGLIDRLDALAKQHDTALLIGLPIDEGDNYYNSSLALGNAQGRYDKRHLVPFGEYLPFSALLSPVLSFLNIPMSDFSPGPTKQANILLKENNVAVLNCVEIIYPFLAKRGLNDAQVLITTSDSVWFGHSLARHQQEDMARMRAVELGIPVLSIGNIGITSIITPDGKIQKALPSFKRRVLRGKVQPTSSHTPWRLL